MSLHSVSFIFLIFHFETDAKQIGEFSFFKTSLNNRLSDCTMNLRFEMKLIAF